MCVVSVLRVWLCVGVCVVRRVVVWLFGCWLCGCVGLCGLLLLLLLRLCACLLVVIVLCVWWCVWLSVCKCVRVCVCVCVLLCGWLVVECAVV